VIRREPIILARFTLHSFRGSFSSRRTRFWRALSPGGGACAAAGHLVHMPAHFIRTGDLLSGRENKSERGRVFRRSSLYQAGAKPKAIDSNDVVQATSVISSPCRGDDGKLS